MSEYSEAIRTACQRLEFAERDLVEAQSLYSKVKALNGQNGYSITIGGVPFAVAVNAGREGGYAAKLRNGCGMIHLGVLKALDADVDRHAALVAEARKALHFIVTGKH